MNVNLPSFVGVLIVILIILAILWLVGLRVHVGYFDPWGKGWCRTC